MLGLSEIALTEEEYAIQIKPRLAKCLDEDFKSREWTAAGLKLRLPGIYTDDFSRTVLTERIICSSSLIKQQ